MNTRDCILAIDQGTTSSRAIAFDTQGGVITVAQREFNQIYPHNGWVEHDAETLWTTTRATSREAVDCARRRGYRPVSVGITNQRETTVVWDRRTGEPIYNAIVWQDRRTARWCSELKQAGHEAAIAARTGLLLDPYFSATELAWVLENVSGARRKARAGELAFGTVDTWLLWRLTGGRVHATDATNACRTMLFNIHDQCWDDDLLALFDIPESLLPHVRDSADDFGWSTPDIFGEPLPIESMIGDQHAAIVGQTCFAPGMVKSTYGTGCFALMNTGDTAVRSDNRLITTLAYRIDGKPTYALEGSIFVAGAAIQWLRDGLGLIEHAAESEGLARKLSSNEGVYLIPAFTGLGAPYWDPNARGALFGLTRDTNAGHLARAALESVAYQTHDLISAMSADAGQPVESLRVDGGMVINDWLVQILADIISTPVERPAITETTAIGAAYLAGLQHGIWPSLESLTEQWQLERRFEPAMPEAQRETAIAGWRDAVPRLLGSHCE
ncbi:glycerol kinase GlpK [Salinisphaera aquimarina]|uniref:Glycerol kinase n=1 Tax=Salinisphaera aquimarina TaxID=2094031 RepID=A0ABV7EUY7_9GAMM